MVKAMYKGENISCTEIRKDNLTECQDNFRRVSGYGKVEVEKYLYYTGCGYDRFYLVLAPDEISLLD